MSIEKVSEDEENEISRINKLMCEEIIKNNGKCHGFMTMGFPANNELIQDLVNIARMDIPSDWVDEFQEYKEMGDYKIEGEWSDEAILNGDVEANQKATELKIINGWYNFNNYEKRIKNTNKEITSILDELEYHGGIVASSDYNNKILSDLGLSAEQLRNVYCSHIYSLYDLPYVDDEILPADEEKWDKENKDFYEKYEPIVEAMTDEEFNKCCDLLLDESLPCIYADAIEEAVGLKTNQAWKFDPLLNAMYGYGEEYKEEFMEDFEKQYSNFKNLVGEEEFNRANMYLNMTKKSINEIYNNSNSLKGYDKQQVDDYFKHNNISEDKLINQLKVVNKDIGLEKFVNDLRKSKEGHEKENTNYKSKSTGRT